MASEPTVYEVGGNSKFETYHYFGEHLTKSAGQTLSKIRMQEEEAQHLVAHGTSHCRMFVSGYKFTLEEHPRKDMNTDYVLTEIQHTAVTDAFPSSGNPEGESYSNTFTCIPLSVPFRPLRVTGRPKINSLQSAVVTGSSGEEINTDQYGRVQVMFPWDRQGTGTYWARVSQVWAGNNWGAMFIPRIGTEVLVDFEEGDPDHPIIVGQVYNATNMPGWPLPDYQNRSGFRSHSTKGGGEHDANVLSFDDTMGDEVFYMRAQKDMSVWVENDDDLHVYNDQTITIGGNRTETVEKGNDKITISTGSQTTTAMQSITLQVGPSSIVLTPTGVTIKGPMIDIEADGILTLKGGLTMIN
jgi:type VI secretion system secreted protein VgrG